MISTLVTGFPMVSIFRVVSSSCEPCDNDPKPMDRPLEINPNPKKCRPKSPACLRLVCLFAWSALKHPFSTPAAKHPFSTPAAKFQPPSAIARCGSSWIPMQSVRIGSFGSAMPSTRRWAEGRGCNRTLVKGRFTYFDLVPQMGI